MTKYPSWEGKRCEVNPLSTIYSCQDPMRRCVDCPRAEKAAVSPDEHRDARYVRERMKSLGVNCPNCGGHLNIGYRQAPNRQVAVEIRRMLDAGIIQLVPIEEAEEQGRQVGMRPPPDWEPKK